MTKKKEVKTQVQSEQRVFKNNGKRFEEDFKASFAPHIWTYRPPDNGGGQMARFTHESICDLMTFNPKTGSLALMELKSTLGTSVSFKPYEFCMAYEKKKKEFEEWNSTLVPAERKKLKEDIDNTKRTIKALYKESNSAMIKYHQIKNLLENEENYGIKGYLLITFFKTPSTYAIPIAKFIEFWKNTTKKSVNEKDLEAMVSEGKVLKIEQSYIRGTMKSSYVVDFLTE